MRDYLGDLANPFSDDALQTFKNLDVISSKVENALHPPDDKTQAIILDIVRGFFGIAGDLGGPAGEAVAEVFQVGIDILAEELDGSDINDINVRASQLEAQLEDRLQNAQKSIARIGDIIVADYTKLSTVGTNAKCAPGPNCPVEWQFTGEDQESPAASMYKGIETLFSEQLMRLAFPAWLLPGPPHNARQWYCEQFVGYRYPFNNTKVNPKQILADTGQAQLIVGNFPNLGFLSQLYALGSGFPNPLSTGKLTVPPASVLNRMFSPASSSLDPKVGGLGMYKPDFMVNANPRDWLDYVPPDNCQWQ